MMSPEAQPERTGFNPFWFCSFPSHLKLTPAFFFFFFFSFFLFLFSLSLSLSRILNREVIFAGSDSLLSEAQYQSEPDIQMFPILAGSVVMVFNVPGVPELTLSREVLSDIYLGTIVLWNDPAIANLNPSVGFSSLSPFLTSIQPK